MQHVVGLNPCPLCIFQRIAYLLLAIAAGIAGLARTAPVGPGVWRLGISLRWLAPASRRGTCVCQAPESLACGPGLGAMLEISR